MKYVKLSSGYDIPQLGLGTWQLTGKKCVEAVREALVMGYTHVDTAVYYGNHRKVGKGITESGVEREKLFITTKLPKKKLRRSQVIETGKKMLNELAIDYIDLLLIHWPNKKVPFAETLEAMKVLVDRGLVKSIGISNFNATIAAEASEVSPLPIVINQVEFHPLLFQKELLDACVLLGMRVTAYSPLAQGKVMQNGLLAQIAEKYDSTAAQISLAWLLEKGIIVIPKAGSIDHLKNNLDAVALNLQPDDLAAIDAIEEEQRFIDGSWKDYDF